MRVLASLVLLAGCADEPHWNLTADALLPSTVLGPDTPEASFDVHMEFDGELLAPDGSLGFSPQIRFLVPSPGATIQFKAVLHNDATGFESWISGTHMWEAGASTDDIRTFAWRECDDDCVLDYTLTISREEELTEASPDTQIDGLVHTYLTDSGNGDSPPDGATLTMEITPL